jgi:flagellar assembly factor FliW
LIYAVVTLRGPGRATANLKGPIVVNRSTGVGKQVVLLNAAQYPLQYVLPSAE